MTLRMDHIAVTARSLGEGVDYVRLALGLDIPPGGRHAQMGTWNHLMRLGEDEFLEVIAPDPTARRPNRPRWYGLDAHFGPPRLATWVVRTDDLADCLQELPPSVGVSAAITRGSLNWLISVPDDGGMPFDGAHPTVIQWPKGARPGAAMPDLGCRLERLIICHPNANEIDRRLAPLLTDDRVGLEERDVISLTAEIRTPSGLRTLK